MTGWTQRQIDAPESSVLTPDEFRKLFGLSAEIYDSLRESGAIPAPRRFTAKTMLHPWEHAVYFALWMRFAPDAVKEKPSKD